MSLKINPSSVHLGKNADGSQADNKFVANYLPVDKASLPLACNLPPEITYTPGTTSLLPLDKACAFTFPDVVPLPPIYNPNTVQFSACETLKAYTEITTTAATKNSNLTLVASGPTPSGEGGPTDCSLKLVGLFDIDACTALTASSNLVFTGAAAGSTLTINTAGTPDCGFELNGNINIDACESFTATASNIKMGGALKGSYITAESKGTPDCGLDLAGILNVNACETFDAKAAIKISGNPVKKSNFTLSKSNVPNCGFNLDGEVLIEACTDFTATSNVKFKGAAIKSAQLRLLSSSQPNCGVDLAGNIDIDACASFSAKSNLTIGGSAVRVNSPISLTATGTPACGFTLDGDIDIDACTNTNLTIVTNTVSPGSITLRTNVPPGKDANWGTPYSSAKLVPRGYTLWQEGCDIGITITLDSVNLAIPDYITSYGMTSPSPKEGCSWDEDDDGIFLHKKADNSLQLGGSMPVPCFACDAAQYTASGPKPYLFSDLELNSLSVGDVKANQCCANNWADVNKLNLCDGILKLYKTFENSTTKPQLLEITADQISFTETGTIGQTRIKTGYIYLIDDTLNYAALEPSSFTIADGNVTDTFITLNPYSMYINSSTNNSLELDSDNIVFSASGGAEASLAANAGFYIKSNPSATRNVSVTYNEVKVSSPSYSATVEPYQITLKTPSAPSKGTTVAPDYISIFSASDNGSIMLSVSALAGKQAYFKEITVCENGVNKKALVLMTDTY